MGLVLSVILWIAGIVLLILSVIGMIFTLSRGNAWLGLPWWGWLLLLLLGILILALTPTYYY